MMLPLRERSGLAARISDSDSRRFMLAKVREGRAPSRDCWWGCLGGVIFGSALEK
jgi:hypothetical protein